MSDDAGAAYFFRVNLGKLASNLTAAAGCGRAMRYEAMDAARWLIQPMRLDEPYRNNGILNYFEPSPFRPTSKTGVYYSRENPAAWLQPDEIAWVKPAPVTHRQAPEFVGDE